MIIKTGLEMLRQDGYKPLHGQRVGIFTNPSAVDHNLASAYSILCNDRRVQVTALFAPEHGFSGAANAGENISNYEDPLTGLPVYSLYGDTHRPDAKMLSNIDVIVCDIQDIGIRYYTFTWTISHILEAAGEHGVTVVILDRPNPLGGKTIYGPLLEPEFSSLVGRFPIPVVHGMTLGELAWMINETWNPHLARLSIIPCEHWEREQLWADTRLPWVPPSPNMPHLHTLHQYAGACLVEGTNLSEGRGTTLPFEIVGAPWIDGMKLAQELNGQGWCADYGVRFRPHMFKPLQGKWADEYCQGVQVHIMDSTHWRPLEVWLNVIGSVRAMYPEHFRWIPENPANGINYFDRLVGTHTIRNDLEAGIPVGQIAADWHHGYAEFSEMREPFLLYE